MTGVEFLEQVAHLYPDAIRIILTGFSDVQSIIDGINNGRIFRYITKPWSENELSMTIENVPSEENPGTGRITPLSVIATLRGLAATLKVGS